MNPNKLTGAWGEAIAAGYLRKKKFSILASGYRSRFGEIDLIAANREFLIFAEVKLRKNADFTRAGAYVDRHKQDRIRMTASCYLAQYPTHLQPRFDVIEIYAPEGRQTLCPKIIHLEDAFQ